MYDAAENWLRVRAEPGRRLFYGTLVQPPPSSAGRAWTARAAAVWRAADRFHGAPGAGAGFCDRSATTGCGAAAARENVIYACKLGDPTNWFSYRGIAADSYAVTVGSDGPFTGAASCMGYALFFKENTLHPQALRLQAFGFPAQCLLRCRGVAKNAARSLCVLNETLYFSRQTGLWRGMAAAHKGVQRAGCRKAFQRAKSRGRRAGWTVLPVSRAGQRRAESGCWSMIPSGASGTRRMSAPFEMASTGGQLYLWDGRTSGLPTPAAKATGKPPTGRGGGPSPLNSSRGISGWMGRRTATSPG